MNDQSVRAAITVELRGARFSPKPSIVYEKGTDGEAMPVGLVSFKISDVDPAVMQRLATHALQHQAVDILIILKQIELPNTNGQVHMGMDNGSVTVVDNNQGGDEAASPEQPPVPVADAVSQAALPEQAGGPPALPHPRPW